MDTIATAARRALQGRQTMLAKVAADPCASAHDLRAAELREVKAALGRIEDGCYGLCERCRGAIGRQRLRAIPEVRLCIACSAKRVE
jgi:RNA polymerase-binding transcription factor DksA